MLAQVRAATMALPFVTSDMDIAVLNVHIDVPWDVYLRAKGDYGKFTQRESPLIPHSITVEFLLSPPPADRRRRQPVYRRGHP
jgi:hypothetical protein